MERRGLPAVALSTDTSILTALGNDYGFDYIFRRQVEALAFPGDVVVGISTSGSSPNVREALLLARERGCRTVALLGRDGGTIRDIVDIDLTVPSHDTPRIQEGHITIIHILCDLVERGLFA
jgi:D-sedoheptulose 7-phosphate isomerase